MTVTGLTTGKSRERAVWILKLVQKGGCGGERMRGDLKARGVDPWPASMLVGKMVKAGLLRVASPGTGNTWSRKYAITDKGKKFLALQEVRVIQAKEEEIDLNGPAEKAIASGKWTPLPVGVGMGHIKEMMRRGFQVRVFVKWDGE